MNLLETQRGIEKYLKLIEFKNTSIFNATRELIYVDDEKNRDYLHSVVKELRTLFAAHCIVISFTGNIVNLHNNLKSYHTSIDAIINDKISSLLFKGANAIGTTETNHTFPQVLDGETELLPEEIISVNIINNPTTMPVDLGDIEKLKIDVVDNFLEDGIYYFDLLYKEFDRLLTAMTDSTDEEKISASFNL